MSYDGAGERTNQQDSSPEEFCHGGGDAKSGCTGWILYVYLSCVSSDIGSLKLDSVAPEQQPLSQQKQQQQQK